MGAPAADTSDEELAARAAAGDEPAFEALVERYQARVYRLACRLTGSESEAPDVLQDTFLKVHRGLAGFRGESRFSTWLLRIAANHAKNRIKYLARRASDGAGLDGAPESAMADLGKAPLHGHVRGPDDVLEAAERGSALERAITALDEDQRLVVILRDVEELSYEEICEVTGLPEGTVKSRLHRARLLLKQWLGPEP
jgi:RNA polymerase sigma-70 factor (ECF subfamily)